MNRPFANLVITGGSGTVSLSTANSQLTGWANGAADSYNRYGDPAVRPDFANNRFLVNAPGIYRFRLVLSGTCSGGSDVVAVPRKNLTAIAGIKGKARITTNKGQVVVEGIFEVTQADLVNAAGVATFADQPSGEFIGAGAAPKTEVPIDVALSCVTSTDTLTVEEATAALERLDG